MSLFHAGLQPAFDSNGDPINGATWNFYLTGTTTSATVYANDSLGVSLGSTVTSNAAGRFSVVYLNDNVKYRAILKDSLGNTIVDVDPIAAGVNYLSAGTGAVVRTVQTKLAETLSVKDFGAKGDGTTDDTAAIQLAINYAQIAGGTVVFPNGRYLVTSTLTVSSLYPVHLIAQMVGSYYTPSAVNWPCILIGAAMTYVIKYVSPQGDRSNGGGKVSGLGIIDPTGTGGTPGSRAVTAALFLQDFGLGVVENCYFHYIKGSAILTDFCVMSTIRGCHIRYCGDTANPTRSVILLGGTSNVYPTQSVNIQDCRVEVNYSTYYISANDATSAKTLDITFRDCKLEAAPSTTEFPLSSNGLMYLNIIRYLVDGCFFNRTGVDSVLVDTGGRGTFVGCVWTNGPVNPGVPYAGTSLRINGAHNIVQSCEFSDTSTGLSIWVDGTNNSINACTFYRSGGVYFPTGVGNLFTGNQISSPTRSAGYFVTTAAGTLVSNNKFTNNGDTIFVGGVLAQNGDIVINNDFAVWPVGTCIRRVDSASVVRGNVFGSVALSYSEAVAGTAGFSIDNFQVIGTRRTGWAVDSGTAKRTANATYTAGATLTYSGTYNQTEQTAMATRMAAVEAALQAATQTIKALKDDLHGTAGHGLIGT